MPVDYEILAVPLPERDSLRFVAYLNELSAELGKVGGDLICWVPIDNPRKIDKAHREKRSPDRARRDQENATLYDQAVQVVGDDRHHIRHQYAELASLVDLDGITRPAIVLLVHGIEGMRVTLSIPPEYLDAPHTRRLLSEMLIDSISKQRFGQYRSHGCFNAGSVRQMQAQLDGDMKHLAHRIQSGAETFCLPGDRHPVSIPLPAGSTWNDVVMSLKDGNTVWIKAAGRMAAYTFADLGMVNRRNGDPTQQWKLLRVFLEHEGQMDWSSSDARHEVKKQKSELCRSLMQIFGLEEIPIVWDRAGKYYICRFQVKDQ